MFKRSSQLMCLVVCFAFLSGCASRQPLIPYPKKETLLFERANNFYKSLVNKKYDRVYAMLSTDIQVETTRDEYIQNLTQFFAVTTIHPQPPEVVKNNGKEGTTRTIVALKIETGTVVVCQQLDWIWERENWYMSGDSGTCIAPSGNFK
jgi:hypothetical protein